MTCAVVHHSKTERNCEPAGVAANRLKEALKETAVALNKKSIEGQETLKKIVYASQCLLAKRNNANDACHPATRERNINRIYKKV